MKVLLLLILITATLADQCSCFLSKNKKFERLKGLLGHRPDRRELAPPEEIYGKPKPISYKVPSPRRRLKSSTKRLPLKLIPQHLVDLNEFALSHCPEHLQTKVRATLREQKKMNNGRRSLGYGTPEYNGPCVNSYSKYTGKPAVARRELAPAPDCFSSCVPLYRRNLDAGCKCKTKSTPKPEFPPKTELTPKPTQKSKLAPKPEPANPKKVAKKFAKRNLDAFEESCSCDVADDECELEQLERHAARRLLLFDEREKSWSWEKLSKFSNELSEICQLVSDPFLFKCNDMYCDGEDSKYSPSRLQRTCPDLNVKEMLDCCCGSDECADYSCEIVKGCMCEETKLHPFIKLANEKFYNK